MDRELALIAFTDRMRRLMMIPGVDAYPESRSWPRLVASHGSATLTGPSQAGDHQGRGDCAFARLAWSRTH